MTRLFVFLFSCCFWANPTIVLSQVFERLYGPGEAAALAQTPDGGFLLAGADITQWERPDKAVLLKTGPDGDQQWSRRYAIGDTLEGFTAVAYTPDGGMLVGGSGADLVPPPQYKETHYVFVMRLNAQGDPIWTWTTPGNWYDGKVAGIVVQPNGDIVAACAPARGTPVLVALSPDGQLRWQQKLSGTPVCLHRLPNGRLAVAGQSSSNVSGAANKAWCSEWEADGTLRWEKNFPQLNGAGGMTPLAGGGFALICTETGPNGQLLRLDAEGQTLWQKAVPTTNYFFWGPLREDQDGNLLLINSSWSNIRLLKLDANGNQLWAKAPYPSQLNKVAANGLLVCSDGQYAFAGTRSDRFLLRKTTQDFPLQFGVVAGSFFFDENDDCQRNPSERALRYFTAQAVDAQGGIYGQTMEASGKYAFELPYGSYEVRIAPRAFDANNWDMCSTQPALLNQADTLRIAAIGGKSRTDCPIQYVHVGSPGHKIRPCTTNTLIVEYANWGTKTATNAKVELELPEELTFEASSVPILQRQGQRLDFDLGTVPFDQGGRFTATVSAACDLPLGSPVCMTAHIFPDTCFPATPGWDKSLIRIETECAGDDGHFTLTNIGKGDMKTPRPWFLFYLCHPIASGRLLLEAGEDTTIVMPNANRASWLWMQEDPLQPFVPAPWAFIKNCPSGGDPSEQYFGVNTGLPFYNIRCIEVKNSFDPNDISAFPRGVGDRRQILTSQPVMEYLVRFQNTGNDTAYQVVIRDTLPTEADPTSLQPEMASHHYSWKVVNNVVIFQFNRIMLPDSNTNLDGSQGFIRFRVNLRPGRPNGTLLKNRAAIYFDFNAPILTNTYIHQMTDPIPLSAEAVANKTLGVKVSPNPASERAILAFERPISGQCSLYDARGTLLWRQTFQGENWTLERRDLPDGLYFYEIQTQTGSRAGGKIFWGQ